MHVAHVGNAVRIVGDIKSVKTQKNQGRFRSRYSSEDGGDWKFQCQIHIASCIMRMRRWHNLRILGSQCLNLVGRRDRPWIGDISWLILG